MLDRGLIVKLALDKDVEMAGMVQAVPIEQSHVLGENLPFVHCIWVLPFSEEAQPPRWEAGLRDLDRQQADRRRPAPERGQGPTADRVPPAGLEVLAIGSRDVASPRPCPDRNRPG